MIKLIYGEKGTGKTKQIIDEANAAIQAAHGSVDFITDSKKYIFDLKHKIKLIDSTEYEIKTELGLLGFIRGLMAADADMEYLFIDGAARMTKQNIEDMEVFYNQLEDATDKNNVKAVLTVSCAKENLPAFLKRFL